MTTVTRPLGTYSAKYLKNIKNIKAYREANYEAYKTYNREYQRKLRQDPERLAEISMRGSFRDYITGAWKSSFKFESLLGMTRQQLMNREGCKDMAEWKAFLDNNEADHIIPISWFRKDENKHLKVYHWRHYNLQFVSRGVNRTKHSYVDETDIRIKWIAAKMQMDYLTATGKFDKAHLKEVEMLGRSIIQLEKQIKIKFES